jgi:hypothetical protein
VWCTLPPAAHGGNQAPLMDAKVRTRRPLRGRRDFRPVHYERDGAGRGGETAIGGALPTTLHEFAGDGTPSVLSISRQRSRNS